MLSSLLYFEAYKLIGVSFNSIGVISELYILMFNLYLFIYLKFWQNLKARACTPTHDYYTKIHMWVWLLYENTHIICPVSIQIGIEIV